LPSKGATTEEEFEIFKPDRVNRGIDDERIVVNVTSMEAGDMLVKLSHSGGEQAGSAVASETLNEFKSF